MILDWLTGADVLHRRIADLEHQLAECDGALADARRENTTLKATKRPITRGEDAVLRLEERVADLTTELNAVAAERDRVRSASPRDLTLDECRDEVARLRITVEAQDQRLHDMTMASMTRDRYKRCGFEGVHV